jgi:hypothetical protein
VVESAPGGSDGGGVGQHAEGPGNLGDVSLLDVSRGLVANTELDEKDPRGITVSVL